MTLELSEDETELLRQILDAVLGDLSPEIADTDNPSYRRALRNRRDHVAALLNRLGGHAG
jgi:hypothetical protein